MYYQKIRESVKWAVKTVSVSLVMYRCVDAVLLSMIIIVVRLLKSEGTRE